MFSNYCGPGGSGKPRHGADRVCQKHDNSDEYKNVYLAYTHYNDADERFLKDMRGVIPQSVEEGVSKFGGQVYFGLKKIMAPRLKGNKRWSTTPISDLEEQEGREHARIAQDVGWHDHNGRAIPDYVSSLRQSLENSPATTQAIMSDDMDTSDDAPKGIEGAESQLSAVHDVWTRFPNSQWARLGWWYTNFISDVAGTIADQTKNAFDDPNWETTTALISTGGGARTSPTGDDMLGVDGLTATTPSGHDFKNPMMFQLRMTTPYNIMKTYTGQGLVGNGVGNSQPAWLEMFEGKYQFYHVSECDWRVDLNFGTPWTTQGPTRVNFANAYNVGYYIFWKYTSNDVPPLSFPISNNNFANGGTADAAGTKLTGKNPLTTGVFTQPCTPDDYFRMKGFHSKHVSLSATGPTHVVLTGKYKFGQCKMDIKQQDHSTLGPTALQTEGWIQTGSTYLFPEDLTIIIVQDNAMLAQSGVLTPVGYRMNTEMLTEFRDLRSAFKFPTPANAFINSGTTINTEAAFFNKGAAYT